MRLLKIGCGLPAIGCALGLLLQAVPACAFDNDNVSVTVGAKGWVSNWTTWRPDNVFYDTGSTQVGEPINSNTQFVVTPQISLVFLNKVLLSASYLAPATYRFTDAITQKPISASRNELDLAAGYYVLQGLVFTAGYKQIQQDYGQGAFKWTGPTVGLAASATLVSGLALYGNFGFGLLKLKVPTVSADAADKTSFDATYSVGEFGLAYRVNAGQVLKSVRFTVGYRAQLLSTRGYALSVSDGTAADILVTPSERDFTQGPTVGVSGTF